MNRETTLHDDGDDFDAVRSAGSAGRVGLVGNRGSSGRASGSRRTGPLQFLREVGDELRQVAWPSRSEMINYTAVVFFTLVLMITLIFLLNLGLGKAVVYMFQK